MSVNDPLFLNWPNTLPKIFCSALLKMADILVIESAPRYRAAITQILSDAGHRVHPAADGVEGLALCRRIRAALVITAIVMPEKDGIEIIREVSREMPDLPILAISGARMASLYLRAAVRLGAAASLRKPFTADELLTAVAALLDRSATGSTGSGADATGDKVTTE